jgi:predicted regulator of Ras-like GTPase activity (Roadblock/LC7/MglB family)
MANHPMTPTKETPGSAEGFQGSVAGLGLSDVIQLNGNNKFSGCITVQHDDEVGRIFFREGRIIHAEQGGMSGEEAFYEIMAWRAGRFSLEPNVSTTSRSIEMNSQHLLLEAHRVIDERRAGLRAAPVSKRSAAPPTAPASKDSPSDILERLRGVRGVAYAVMVGKDGVCIDDNTFAGEALAGKAAYVAMVGDQLGATFGIGHLRSAVVHGGKRHMLLMVAKNHYLSLSVEGVEVGAVAADVRRLLGLGH